MKIVQIIPVFDMGGAEIMCENLSYELKKKGNEVIVVSLYSKKTVITDRLEKDGVKVYFFDKKEGLDLKLILKLIKFLKKEKPDVVHTHIYAIKYGIIASIFSGIKRRVHTVHNIAEKECGNIDKRINKIFYKYFSVTPVALSNLIKDTIIKEYSIKEEKIPVVFNGINLKKCQIKEDYSIKEKIKICHIGRFSEQKNHRGLVKAFKIFNEKYPDSILNLIGVGELEETIKKLVEENNLTKKVNFLGLQSNVCSYLNKADIFTLPSNYEGIPMTLIEAMGTGIPIVTTNVGGIPNMLKNDESALIVKNEIKLIAQAFEKLVLNNELREKIGKNALKESKFFSSEEMARKYIKIYKKSR